MSQRIRWLGLGLIVVPLLTLIALEINQALWRSPALKQDRERVVHTFMVITTAQSIERLMIEAENSERGYLITGNPDFLATYLQSRRQVPVLLARLKNLVLDNPEQRARNTELEVLITDRLELLERTLKAHKTDGMAAARELIASERAPETTGRISGAVQAMIGAEQAVLTGRLGRAAENEQDTLRTALLSGALGLAVVLLFLLGGPSLLNMFSAAEKERDDIAERLRLVINGVADYAIYMLDPHGIVTSWNVGAQRIKGYAAEEILGQHFGVFYTEEERSAGAPDRVLNSALREGKYEAETWRVRKDGSRFLAQVLVEPLRAPSGKLVGFAKITRDVTERVKQQQALDQARAALAQSQKMEAVGQLSGGIAHDFNNFLHVIKNAVEILQRRFDHSDADVTRLLDLVQRNADRAAHLTQRLLAFSRRQPLEPKAVNPNRLIIGITEMLRQTLGESVAVETVLAGGVWQCFADQNQLETAILNLAINARDAMPEGGKITIETANTALDEVYAAQHAEVKPGQYVMIAVSDTGAGMDQDTKAKAFEPFYTTKPVGRGTGLGLSQVYGFIKQSEGHVNIYSEPNSGTTVRLYLPRVVSDAREAEVAELRPAAQARPHETVLLVEDNADVRVSTAEMLGQLGYRVLLAPDARVALKVLDEEPGISLLFTDVGLPDGINGRQLADAARARWPQLKVLFTTGYARNAIIHHGRLDPGVALIVKPFTGNDLAVKLRQVLEESDEPQAGS